MALMVLKFGGTSVADSQRIRHICSLIARAVDAGNQVVVVLSAQGHTTDRLMDQALELNPNPSGRELDMLLTTGEQISISLAALCMEHMGYDAVSLTGWQAGIRTTDDYTQAQIQSVSPAAIKKEDQWGNLTTLGRGGSDTTAVALAAALRADVCQIYTDVDGVYTADPRKDPTATKLEEISYEAMLDMAQHGAQVLHDRCVILARRHNIPIEVRSSFHDVPGTWVRNLVAQEHAS